MLEQSLDSLNTSTEDSIVEKAQVAEKLMIMHEECLEGNFKSIESLRKVSVPHVRQGGVRMADVAGNVLLVTIECADARHVSIDVLHWVFRAFGFVHKITIFEKTAGFQALVQFSDTETASSAKNARDGRTIPRYLLPDHVGPCVLRITYSAHTDLSVKFQSDRSRDYTNPHLPGAPSAIDGSGQSSVSSSEMKHSLVQKYLKVLNTANKEDVKKLKGIGEKRATYILSLRDEKPEPFKSLNDLSEIGLSTKQVWHVSHYVASVATRESMVVNDDSSNMMLDAPESLSNSSSIDMPDNGPRPKVGN